MHTTDNLSVTHSFLKITKVYAFEELLKTVYIFKIKKKKKFLVKNVCNIWPTKYDLLK